MLNEVVGENVCVYPASGKPSNLDLPSAKTTWKFGDFGEAHPDVAKKLNIYKVKNTVQISQFDGEFKQNAVLSNDRKTLTYYGAANSIDILEWSSDEVKKLLESGDPMEAPPNPYKIQPENHGKLLFISGAPGLGKSTTGMLLGKNFGYVYYEADAFLAHLNPYTPTDVDEPNALHVLITKDMSRDDVVDKIIKMVNNYRHCKP